jgi:predicted S18 family serine protease
MQKRTLALSFMAVLILLLAGVPKAAFVGNSSIVAPAVILTNDSGSLSQISLAITTGNGTVTVKGPLQVGNDTNASAMTAARYASSYLDFNFSRYNFAYYINDTHSNISGPSAGAAMTLLAISAFSHVHPVSNFTMTGTINSNGTIGLVGGVYNKVQAAKADGARFVLVPYSPNGSLEETLYYLIQGTFGIPLVQVSNMSEAVQFALYNKSIAGEGATYTTFTNYSMDQITNASQQCTSCNTSHFNDLANFTFGLTNSEINSIQPAQNFSQAVNGLDSVLNVSEQIASKGYIYTGADLAFINYLNAFFFAHNLLNATTGLSTITAIQTSCITLIPPQLTSSNYEFVLGGELRQGWANYTLTSILSTYNVTNMENDEVLLSVYSAGEANAWCSASSKMYNLSYSMGGAPVEPSAQLASLASTRISQMLGDYGNSALTAVADGDGMYVVSAEAEFKAGDYPVAILDADYAIAMAQQAQQIVPTNSLINVSKSMLAQPTFGVWSTQFALESRFYMQEASIHSSNISASKDYAQQAYTSALLAARIGNDTRLIAANLLPTGSAQNQQTANAIQIQQLTTQLQSINNLLYYILIVAIIVLATNAVILAFIVAIHLIHADNQKREIQKRKKR